MKMDETDYNIKAKATCSDQLARGEITLADYEWLTGDYREPLYFVPYKRKSKVHLYRDGDTLCRMLSTSGLKEDGYHVEKKIGERRSRQICSMCASMNV
jgi:hypothetical protein